MKRPRFLDLTPDLLLDISRYYLSADSLTSLPLQKGFPSALVLSQICKAWHAFVLSTPVLWSSIRIDFPQDLDEAAAQRIFRLVTLWMERSGNHTLNIQITIHPTISVGVDEPTHSCSTSILTVFAPLLENSHRWKYVCISTTFLVLKCLAEANTCISRLSAPYLTSLEIEGEESGTEDTDGNLDIFSIPIIRFSAAPSLRRVSLSEVGLLAAHSSAFLWEGVEDLTLSGMFHDLSFSECASVLHQCTTLKHCRLSTSFTTRADQASVSSVRPINLDSLQLLEITEHSPPDGGGGDIYRHIICLDLEELRFRYVLRDFLEIHGNTSYWTRDSLMAILDMSSQLTRLQLWSLPLDEVCLIEVLDAIPQLTHLTIISWRPIQSAGDKLLHGLSLTTYLGHFVLLKGLEYIHIESHACSEASVVSFVRSRRSVAPFRLKEVSFNLLGTVPPDLLASRLAKHREEGLIVNIGVGGGFKNQFKEIMRPWIWTGSEMGQFVAFM